MVSSALIEVLAYGHVLSAIGWLGAGLLTTFVLGPGLRRMPPAAAREFTANVMPNIVRYVVLVVSGTLTFGLLLLYFTLDGDFSKLNPGTSFGLDLSIGMTLAVIAAGVALSVVVPSFRKVIKMAKEGIKSGAQGPPPPDMMKYSKRARMGSIAAVGLLLVVVVFMVGAGFGFP